MENGQEEKPKETVESVSSKNEEENSVNDKTENSEEKEPSTELLKKIQGQVEFYFGDVNMQRDKFLNEQMKLDEGWIPMAIMKNFNMLSSMSKDVDIILKALESSDLIEISEDRTKIRRSLKHPLPVYDEAYKKTQEAKTVYLKGFPLKDTTIEKLKTFFNQFEPYENIIMRKYQDKKKVLQFKGSVFVQFKTLEDAKAFMEREPISYEDTELIRMWSADHCIVQAKEREERKQQNYQNKNRKEEAQAGKNKDQEETKNEDSGKKIVLPKGTILHFCVSTSLCAREDIKEEFKKCGIPVSFIDYKKGDSEGWIRLQEENSAKSFLDVLKDNKFKIKHGDVVCRLLNGEEEEEYLAKVVKTISNIRQQQTKTKHGRKNRGKSDGGPREKKIRIDSSCDVNKADTE